MIRNILVLGGGSAGFLTALTLKLKLPGTDVKILRSSKLGIIGVGEGSTFTMPNFLHGYLGINPATFHAAVRPTYKLGIKFLWGPRDHFFYSFTSQLDARYTQLSKANGYYMDEDYVYGDLTGALMAHNRVFERQQDGGPTVLTNAAYHLENKQFVEFLERAAREAEIPIVEGTVANVELDESGVKTLHLESGESVSADFYADCSGFRSELIGRALEQPFVDYSNSLFCDKALIGGWDRTDEPLYPYTTAETMDAGWCWQIEHDSFINRGYVYSSNFISDEDAEREFRTKNPKVGDTRIVSFKSGRYEKAWVKNVVAIGNSSGFVEPLEATALAVIIDHAAKVVRTLADSQMELRPLQIKYFNEYNENNWDAICRFLALHYKFNTRIENDFWRACWQDTDIGSADKVVEFYQENGPSLLWVRHLIGAIDPFGWEGYLAMLVGQKVPYEYKFTPNAQELEVWKGIKQTMKTRALAGMRQEEALEIIRSPRWQWRPDFYANASKF